MKKSLTRRSLLIRSLLSTGAALAAPQVASARIALPYKPIRILIGYPSSGGSDSMVHIISGELQTQVSRSITVDYKPGESGIGAGEQLKKSTPDGSVIGFMPNSTLVGRLTLPGFPFDPLTDLRPITLAGTYPTAFGVSPRIGVTTFDEYVAWVKADPSRAKFGTTTPGSFTQFFGTALGNAIGVPLEAVPYRGARALVGDMEQGRIPAGTAGITSFITPYRGGRVKLLTISSAKRLPVAPAVPTIVEVGFPKLEQTGWYAFFAPPGMETPLVDAWAEELRVVLESREVVDQLRLLGFNVETSTPAEMAARLASDFAKWKADLDLLGIKTVN